MGSRCLTLQGASTQKRGTEGADALSLLFPPQKQFKEGKLYPRNDPARGLNYSRLKPVPCFKDLCNLKWKKKKNKVIRFKVKFSLLDSFRNIYIFNVKFYYCCFHTIPLSLSPHANSGCHSDSLDSAVFLLRLSNSPPYLLSSTTNPPMCCS